MFKKLSLRYRIALVIFVLEACMLAGVLSVTLTHSKQAATDFNSASQNASLDLLSNLSITALLTSEYSDYQLYIQDVQKQPSLERIVLADYTGRVVAASLVTDVGLSKETVIRENERGWKIQSVDTAAGSLGTLAVKFSDAKLVAAHHDTRNSALAIAAAGMILIAMVGLATGFALTRRLMIVARAASRFAEGDHTARSEVDGRDEVAVLSSSVDRMASAVAESEKLLQEQKEYIELLLDSTAEGIYGVNEKGICTFVNTACLNMLGYENENDLIGKSIHELIHHTYPDGNHYPKEQCKIRLASLQGESTRCDDEVHWRADGSSFPIEYWSRPMYQEDKLIGTAVSFIDISERKKNEDEANKLREQISQSSKMESIGHLTAGIAHDFNNMLAAIMGYAELSQHMLAAGKTAEVASFQVEILNASDRAKELIAQMLTFSRLSPKYNGEETPVTLLTPIVKEVVTLLRSSIPRTVEINYRIEDEDVKTRIQPVHLHQIILNLGVNARDALAEYGQIDISVAHYHGDNRLCSACKKRFSGDYARVTVKDSGSGIPKHALSSIFDPFFTTKGVGKGTGMGLSVVHGLVHSLGGHILVESSVEGGTSFNILLPLELSAPNLDNVTEVAAVVNIKGTRIMLVDDEIALSHMLQEFLIANGANVVAFNDPVLALEAFTQQSENIDVVITDETMPGMSGMLLSKKLLELKSDLSIILCTGYSEHATLEKTTKLGISAFFQKPLNMNKLMQKISDLHTPS